jgi:hypothetical protein
VTEQKRRGGHPKRKPEPGERVAVSWRFTPEDKTKLERAAAASGRSLAQEIEQRLSNSFRDEERDALFSEIYFGRRLAALLEIIGRSMQEAGRSAMYRLLSREEQMAGNPFSDGDKWLDDPKAFMIAVRQAVSVVKRFAPEGDSSFPAADHYPTIENMSDHIVGAITGRVASELLEPWTIPLRAKLGPRLIKRAKRAKPNDVEIKP